MKILLAVVLLVGYVLGHNNAAKLVVPKIDRHDSIHSHNFGSSLNVQEDTIKTITITRTKKVPIPVPKPVPIPIIKQVPVPVKVPIKVPVLRPYAVPVPKPYPVIVRKPIIVEVEKKIPYPVKVPQKVPVLVPQPIEVPKPFAVTINKPFPVKVPYPVVVEKKIPVIVEPIQGDFGQKINDQDVPQHGGYHYEPFKGSESRINEKLEPKPIHEHVVEDNCKKDGNNPRK